MAYLCWSFAGIALLLTGTAYSQYTGQCGYPTSLSRSGFEAGEQAPYVQLPPETTPLTLTVDYPPEGAVITASSLQVYGSLTGPANTGVTVNQSQWATTDASDFTTQLMTLPPGPQTLTVIATTLDGATQTVIRNITVSPQAPAEVRLLARSAGHFAPLRIGFDLQTRLPGTQNQIARVQMDYDGDGDFELDTSDAATALSYFYDRPGTYLARARVSFDDGDNGTPPVIRESTFRIQMHALPYTRQLLCDLYAQMRQRLLDNQPASALHTLAPNIRPRFDQLWQQAGPGLPMVAARLGDLVSGRISNISAEYLMAISDPNRPGAYLGFPVQFARTADGVWRISGM